MKPKGEKNWASSFLTRFRSKQLFPNCQQQERTDTVLEIMQQYPRPQSVKHTNMWIYKEEKYFYYTLFTSFFSKWNEVTLMNILLSLRITTTSLWSGHMWVQLPNSRLIMPIFIMSCYVVSHVLHCNCSTGLYTSDYTFVAKSKRKTSVEKRQKKIRRLASGIFVLSIKNMFENNCTWSYS